MGISRRDLLKFTAAGAGVAGLGIVNAQWQKTRILSLARGVYQRLSQPDLENGPTGVLSDRALRMLMATTQAIVDSPLEPGHYQDFFRWRSENVAGYHDLYEQFSSTLDSATRKKSNRDFADHDHAGRREILREIVTSDDRVSLGKVRRGVFDKDSLRYERHIVGEILELFSVTDAWVLLGYSSWPGTPRGLEEYQKAPASTG
jgi:hypothetical protein